MTVRVYFPESKMPLEYAVVHVTREQGVHDLEVRDGDLVFQEFGVYLRQDQEENIMPWGSIRNIRMQRQV